MKSDTILNWLKQFKQNCPTYKNGFIRIPFKGNSPELLIHSFETLPFVKHNKMDQRVFSNSPIITGHIYYQQLEQGCWVFYSKTKVKTNICFELIKTSKIPHKYYCLSLNKIDPKPIVYKELSEKKITFPQYSWSLQTPYEENVMQYINLKFSGTTSIHVSVYFDEEWYRKNLLGSIFLTMPKLEEFIHFQKDFLFSALENTSYIQETFSAFESLFGVNSPTQQPNNLLGLKMRSLNMVVDFFQHCKKNETILQNYILYNDEQEAIPRIEKYLMEHLQEKFMGIDFLSKKFDISESKLKAEFKQYYGKPIYQYFQEKQMLLAKILLQDGHTQVKEIAYKFNYENSSKFSAAFRKIHGKLPSEI